MEGVAELDATNLTYAEFRDACLAPNRPALIRNAGHAMRRGSSTSSPSGRGIALSGSSEPCFSLSDMRRRLSPEALLKTFGPAHRVPVYGRGPAGGASGESVTCEADDDGCLRYTSLGRVLESWGAHRTEGGPVPCSSAAWYLKDWHYQLDLIERSESEGTDGHAAAELSALYEVPEFLGEDWLNNFCDAARGVSRSGGAASAEQGGGDSQRLAGFGTGSSDFRFVYLGPPATWTPLHYDVYGTYSWSLNLWGGKLWYFPVDHASNELLLHNLRGAHDGSRDIRVMSGIRLAVFEQQPGDLVFVPSRYYHQVHNVPGASAHRDHGSGRTSPTDSAVVTSINHNWCNAYCIAKMVDCFEEQVAQLNRLVPREDRIALFGDDDAGWHAHMERMLLSSTNWNFAAMHSFLRYVAATFGPRTGCPATISHCMERVALLEAGISRL